MADSYLLTVEKALETHLTTELQAVDAEVKIHRGRDRLGASDKAPAVSFLQALDVDNQVSEAFDANVRSDGKIYLLAGYGINYDATHKLLADTKKALSKLRDRKEPNHMLGEGFTNPLVAKIDVAMGVVRPTDKEMSSKYSFFWLPVRILLTEDMNDPYKLP